MTTEAAVMAGTGPPSPPPDQVASRRPGAAVPASALRISVLGAQPDPATVAPQMLVRLRVEERSGAEVLLVADCAAVPVGARDGRRPGVHGRDRGRSRPALDLPVSAWRAVMDQDFPGQAWLRADRGAIAELTRYKAARGHSTWEQALGELLAGARSAAR